MKSRAQKCSHRKTNHHRYVSSISISISISINYISTLFWYPNNNGNDMILMHRCHKRTWATTQLIAFLLVVTTTMAFVHGFLIIEQRLSLLHGPSKRKISSSYLASASARKEDPETAGDVRTSNGKRPTNGGSTEKPLFAPSSGGASTRKTKTNKYADFSKVDNNAQDPFEVLVEESRQKLQSLQDATNSTKRREQEIQRAESQAPAEATKQLEFPDITKIDPYDPTTFGYVEIGTILGPHGVHGWTKVKGCTDFPERLTRPGMPLHLKPHRKRAPRKTTVANGKMIDQDSFLVQLQGVYDRTAAQKLKGATLYYATQQDTVVKDDDEVIVSDLVGLDVYTLSSDEKQEPTLVGHVQGVVLAEDLCDIPWLLHDQIEVALARGNDSPRPGRRPQDLVLIPLVPEIVPKIDLEGNMILVDPPAGLLDLTYVREEKVRIKGLLAPARED